MKNEQVSEEDEDSQEKEEQNQESEDDVVPQEREIEKGHNTMPSTSIISHGWE